MAQQYSFNEYDNYSRFMTAKQREEIDGQEIAERDFEKMAEEMAGRWIGWSFLWWTQSRLTHKPSNYAITYLWNSTSGAKDVATGRLIHAYMGDLIEADEDEELGRAHVWIEYHTHGTDIGMTGLCVLVYNDDGTLTEGFKRLARVQMFIRNRGLPEESYFMTYDEVNDEPIPVTTNDIHKLPDGWRIFHYGRPFWEDNMGHAISPDGTRYDISFGQQMNGNTRYSITVSSGQVFSVFVPTSAHLTFEREQIAAATLAVIKRIGKL